MDDVLKIYRTTKNETYKGIFSFDSKKNLRQVCAICKPYMGN